MRTNDLRFEAKPRQIERIIRADGIYAIKMVIGDLGTYAGIKTDDQARALDAEGHPIAGLYAVGNDMASIMGGNYPGAGITLGPALTFGYIAGKHISGDTLGLATPGVQRIRQ